MKAKLLFLISGLALCGLLLSGCYTQVARPDQESEPRITGESEAEAEEAESDDEGAYRERDATNIYVYGGGWYRYPWWYRYPHSGLYVSVGFGYYDWWDWCGTAWTGWYDPWCYDRYYAGYWRPYRHGWYPGYYDPYYPYPYVYRDRERNTKRRDFGRRGTDGGSDLRPTYSTGGRGSLAKPVATTYGRGNDGNYRRIRRDGVTSTISRRNQPATATDRIGTTTDDSRRRAKRLTGDNEVNSPSIDRQQPSGASQPAVRRTNKPAPTHDRGAVSRRSSSGSSGSGSGTVTRRSGSSTPSGSGGSVSKPSGSSSGSGSAPKSSGKSSNSGSSSNRRSRN